MGKDKKLISKSLHIKVKTAKGRKLSSTRWLERQLNDPYVQSAKEFGYRSRAAYKLIDINEKFEIFKNNRIIVDLGAAPGGWTQVIIEKAQKNAIITGIDLKYIEPLLGAKFLEMDFLSDEASDKLKEIFPQKIDLILSDMAASSSGHQMTDHLRIMNLCEAVFEFAASHLNMGGNVVVKMLHGAMGNEFLLSVKKSFNLVKHFKPAASRKESSEIYLIALGYKGASEI